MENISFEIKKYLIRKMFVKNSKGEMKILIESPSGLVFFDEWK